MGIQITTQPQVLKTDTVIIGSNNNNNLSAVSGITVYGDVSASGVYRGDGSKLTGLVATGISGISLVNSIDGLTGIVTNAYIPISGSKTITGSLTSTGSLTLSSGSSLTILSGGSITSPTISATSISGTHYGSGSNLSGVVTLTGAQTITGSLTSNSSLVLSSGSSLVVLSGNSITSPTISATSISGTYYGSGSNLTGVVTLTGNNTITASLTSTGSLTLSGGSLSAAAVSAINFYGDGSKLTGVAATSLSGVSYVSNIDGLTGAVTDKYLPLSGNKTIANRLSVTGINGVVYDASSIVTGVATNSADWTIGKTLSTNGYKLTTGNTPRIEGDLVVTGRISALSGATFFNTTFTTTSSLCVINAASLSQVAFYVGASGTGDIASFFDLDQNIEVLHVGGANSTFKNVGVKTSTPNKDFTVVGEISSTGSAWFGSVNTHAISGGVTAVSGSFTNNISAASISGTYYGNGSNLTGVVALTGGRTITGPLTSTSSLMLSGTAGIVTLSGGTLTLSGATSLITSPAISVTTLTAFNSITSPVVSATTLTAFGGTFRTSLSTVTISADNLVVSGYPLQAVSRVYQVGTTAATSTYTIALSDNNNTLTMFVGTSGLIVIPSPTTFPIGFQTNIMQLSTGRVLLSAQSANTLFNDMSSYRTLKQYSAATIINLGSIWVTYGSLSS